MNSNKLVLSIINIILSQLTYFMTSIKDLEIMA